MCVYAKSTCNSAYATGRCPIKSSMLAYTPRVCLSDFNLCFVCATVLYSALGQVEQAWASERQQVIEQAVRDFLLPSLQAEVIAEMRIK